MNALRDNAAGIAGNALTVSRGGNAHVIPISSTVRQCPTCQHYFSAATDHQRYCCPSHKVTGCKRRRRQLETAWVVLVTTMSAGRINAQRALDCIEWNAKRCEYVLGLWGFEFDGNDELVRGMK